MVSPACTISASLTIPADEIRLTAIRASGPGGQHVNKASTAVHLRFDIRASSLPEPLKERLLQLNDHHITAEGQIIIKAREYRSLEKNREAALARLRAIILRALAPRKVRRPTRATRGSQKRRVDRKTHRGKIKKMRRKVDH
ncbi:aminoacyl-tRNA hydrolase [Desulfolithobacter dissulfuricans]|uniref:Aminoacyl-tRNA hydrolase n=1 Tax=Desulfolithobacter dissulfuricans TaxID=2795293 RepID=A0A915XHS1_9BACT|nr:alternative ribosome rescue aminoacyl-tRNA hydrolase ArfB [Desulfolithobacter dissulfuricans]BCO08989.1 aminoacyl-tRNA hydrolase [Desulfolithobacter dissulfuricans]